MPKQKYLLVIAGSTAIGKTSLGIKLAQHFETEILSADSRQIYKEMHIGTAKPNEKELSQAKHHFIGNVGIENLYNVGQYQRDALALLEELFEKHPIVLMVGGTGLYIKALCEGLDEFPPIKLEVKEKLQKEYKEKGISFLQNELKKYDIDYYNKVDKNNHQRLLRALEVCLSSGKPFSSFFNKGKKQDLFTPIYIHLEIDRELLYKRINIRVDNMIQEGLLEEAKTLLNYSKLNSLQTVGYKELFSYLHNEISLEEAIRLIKRNTRRYAKRQNTWFRNQGDFKSFVPSDIDGIVKYVNSIIRNES